MNCPHCAQPLSERGSFCKACGAQARCMKCREVLEPGAVACVECGTRLGQPVTDPPNGVVPTIAVPPPNRNTLTYHEDRNSRRFEASLTDSAMEGLGDVFGELFAQRGVGRIITHPQLRTMVREEVIPNGAKQLPPAPPAENDLGTTAGAPTSDQPPSDKQRMLTVFSVSGNTLELIDNRLKATSAADYYRRLTYLFLYAQELNGRTTTPKDQLLTLLKDAKVLDSNCRAWLKQKKGFTVDAEDRLKLNAAAREQAVKTLNETLDPNVTDGWNPDTKTTKQRTQRKKKA